jgi:hypothetical protein
MVSAAFWPSRNEMGAAPRSDFASRRQVWSAIATGAHPSGGLSIALSSGIHLRQPHPWRPLLDDWVQSTSKKGSPVTRGGAS